MLDLALEFCLPEGYKGMVGKEGVIDGLYVLEYLVLILSGHMLSFLVAKSI